MDGLPGGPQGWGLFPMWSPELHPAHHSPGGGGRGGRKKKQIFSLFGKGAQGNPPCWISGGGDHET